MNKSFLFISLHCFKDIYDIYDQNIFYGHVFFFI